MSNASSKSKIKRTTSKQDLVEDSTDFINSSSKPKPPLNRLMPWALPVRNSLASPFASRAPSPIDSKFTLHVALSEKSMMGPPALPTLDLIKKRFKNHMEVFEQNPPDCSRSRAQSLQSNQSEGYRLSRSVGAHSSLSKPRRRKYSVPRSTYGRSKSGNKENCLFVSWKDRRPSAPASLQRPLTPIGKAFVPSKVIKTSTAKVKNDTAKRALRSRSEIHFRSPLTMAVTSPKENKNDLDLFSNHDPYSWMNARSAIDFNRPPSQLSMTMVPLFNRAEDETQGALSSGEDEDEEDDKGQRRAGVEQGFSKDVFLTSTPFKNVLVRSQNSHVLGRTNAGRMHDEAGSELMESDIKNKALVISTCDGRSEEKDMELTGPLGREANTDISFPDRTPWITDSIISPPTIYLYHQEKDADTLMEGSRTDTPGNIDLDNKLRDTQSKDQNLDSPYLHVESTCPPVDGSSTMDDSSPGGQEECKNYAEAMVKGKVTNFEPPRVHGSTTKFGSTRRTRTGTIVGPSSANNGRTRSGTIVAKAQEQTITIAGARRTRSGTIIGPLPDSTVSAKGGVRCRSGTILSSQIPTRREIREQKETADENREGYAAAPAVGDNEGEGFGACIEEPDEVKGLADSLYVPCLTSSPDPINFLRAAEIMEDEDESVLNSVLGAAEGGIEYVKEMVWCVADEPPSPNVWQNPGTYTPGGYNTNSGILIVRTRQGRRVKSKGKGKGKSRNLTRFLGVGSLVEDVEPENQDRVDGDVDRLAESLSDDELLLVEGQSTALFT